MRGKKAKAIRRAIYGDLSPYVRRYLREPIRGGYRVTAGMLRRKYQAAKARTHKPAPMSKTVQFRIRTLSDQSNFETLKELKARQRKRRAKEAACRQES